MSTNFDDTYWEKIEKLKKKLTTKDVVSSDPPIITVVTVCYNPLASGRKGMLLKNLDSVQAQEGVSLEHLIIDGASTDGTLDFLQEYKNTHFVIRILSHSDCGIYDAMNRGLAVAEGKYVIFLNTDDYYHSSTGLRDSLNILNKTKCDFTFAPIRAIYKTHSKIVNPCPRLDRIFVHSVLSHQSILAKREDLLKLHGFDISYNSAADYDLELRMLCNGLTGSFVPSVFVSYSMAGISSVNIQQSQKESASALQSIYASRFETYIDKEEALSIHLKHKIPSYHKSLFFKIRCLTKTSFKNVPYSIKRALTSYWDLIRIGFK